MIIEYLECGGYYQWFINSEETDKSESAIFSMLTNDQRRSVISQINLYGSARVDTGEQNQGE